MVEVVTARLLVRDPLPEDLPGWHRLHSDTQNMRFVEHMWTRTPEESRARLQSAMDAVLAVPRVKYFFTAALRQTGEFAGCIGFMAEPAGNNLRGNIGWFLLPEQQGKGYASEAFLALIPHMFTDWGITLIDAGCNAANTASARVMQKGGMALVRQEGGRLQYQLRKTDWEKHHHP